MLVIRTRRMILARLNIVPCDDRLSESSGGKHSRSSCHQYSIMAKQGKESIDMEKR